MLKTLTRTPNPLKTVQPLGAEDSAEAELSELIWTSNVMELSALTELVCDSNWYVQQQPRNSWLVNAGERFVVERLANGIRAGMLLSADASTTLAALDELMGWRILQCDAGAFENGRRVLQDNDDAQATLNLVIRNGEGLYGIVTENISGPTCRLPFARCWTRMCQVNWCWPFSFTATKSTPAG